MLVVSSSRAITNYNTHEQFQSTFKPLGHKFRPIFSFKMFYDKIFYTSLLMINSVNSANFISIYAPTTEITIIKFLVFHLYKRK